MAIRRIALAAGFTAGHVFPMLAVAEAFRARHPDAEILAIGGQDGPEAALIAAAGCEFHAISGAPLHGLATWRDRLVALPALLRGFFQARRLLRAAGSEIVVGFGAYISAGSLLAARSLGIPTAILEPNAVPGLANRLLARLVDLRLAVVPDALPGAALVDYPLRTALAAARRNERAQDATLRVLITGGSRGSEFLNRAAPDLLARLRARGKAVVAHHQCGSAQTAEIAAAYAAHGLPARVTPFIDDMAGAYAEADLVISAAGAGTLAEIDHLALPALIVPIEGLADEHQLANAAACGHAVARESAWRADEIAETLMALLGNARRAAASPAKGAAQIAALCERLLAEGASGAPAALQGVSSSESARS